MGRPWGRSPGGTPRSPTVKVTLSISAQAPDLFALVFGYSRFLANNPKHGSLNDKHLLSLRCCGRCWRPGSAERFSHLVWTHVSVCRGLTGWEGLPGAACLGSTLSLIPLAPARACCRDGGSVRGPRGLVGDQLLSLTSQGPRAEGRIKALTLSGKSSAAPAEAVGAGGGGDGDPFSGSAGEASSRLAAPGVCSLSGL